MADLEKPNIKKKFLTKVQRDNMSDSTRDGSFEPRTRKSLIEVPYYEDWFLESYKEYFAVTTDQVIQRIQDSVFPFSKNPLFLDTRIDLYGPLWVYFTLNV